MTLFTERLKEQRQKKGLKQSEVAEKIGVSTQSYSTYENGREPNYDILKNIADYFDCSIDYLLGLSETIKPLIVEDIKDLGLSAKSIMSIKEGMLDVQPKRPIEQGDKSIKDILNLILEDEERYFYELLDCIRIAGRPSIIEDDNTINGNREMERNAFSKLAHDYLDAVISEIRNLNM